MSIFSSFKKALGFPDEFDDDLEDDIDLPEKIRLHKETAAERPAVRTSAPEKAEEPSATVTDVEPLDNNLPGEVFDAVIRLFNETQPQFVRDCLDSQAQREYLLSRIDESLRERLRREVENARKSGQQNWTKERNRMSADVEKLKSEYHMLKQQREEFQSAQLSAARQKRALSERIHDLESQVKTLEADREQMQLENRSMINKLRVANVRSASDAETEAGLQRLAQENVELQDKINSLKDKAKSDSKRIADLEKELKEKTENEPDGKQQLAIAEIEAQIAQFENIKERKNKKINDLTAQNRTLSNNFDKITKELASRNEENTGLNRQIEELNKQIEKQKAAHENDTRSLHDEIKRLTELVNAASVDAPAKNKPGRKRKKNRNNAEQTVDTKVDSQETTAESTVSENPEQHAPAKISAIDELMDSTDWFIAPEPTPLKKDPEVEEEFGYKEPQRKPSHDDDKQLSLF